MTPRRPWGPLVVALSLAPGAAAQSSEVVVEVGASQLRPPLEVDGAAARFLVGGVRASRFGPGGSGAWAAGLAGRALDGAWGANFVSGDAGAAAWLRLSRTLSLGAEVKGFAFEIADPYPYRAAGLEGSLGVRASGAAVTAGLAATGGVGRSRAELRRYVDGPARVFTDDLWRYGAEAELLVGGRGLAAGATASLHETAGGTFRSLGGRLVLAAGASAVELRLDGWDTPSGAETTGGLTLVVPWGAWVARGFAGRSAPDPLTLADPGRGGGGMLVGWRLVGGATALREDGVAEVGETASGLAGVRFRLEAPGAASVTLLGDFTLWEPVTMTREGDVWRATLPVPVGVHHFGFMVDGTWHVPDGVRDRVPDEWGRTNAILVVEANDTDGREPGVEGAVR